ncbi:hypothetical protein Aperf_G00000091773 [Anoplocephala perfoliata]
MDLKFWGYINDRIYDKEKRNPMVGLPSGGQLINPIYDNDQAKTSTHYRKFPQNKYRQNTVDGKSKSQSTGNLREISFDTSRSLPQASSMNTIDNVPDGESSIRGPAGQVDDKSKSLSRNNPVQSFDPDRCRRRALSEDDSLYSSTRETIGQGTYATVYKYQSKSKGTTYAEKVIKMNREEGAPGTAIREVSLLKELDHPNIISQYGIRYVPGQMTILLEYVPYTLHTYIEKFNLPSDQGSVQKLTCQLFSGLNYIHDKDIIHRDLKPENLLITSGGVLKIADFGLARQICRPLTEFETRVVTLWYKPPELLLGIRDYGKEIDVWSAGCIVYEMMKGEPLFCAVDIEGQLKIIFEVIGLPSRAYWPELFNYEEFRRIQWRNQQYASTVKEGNPEVHDIKSHLMPLFEQSWINRHWLDRPDAFDLLEECLQPCGSKRISVKQAVKHSPFLRNSSRSQRDSGYSSIITTDTSLNHKRALEFEVATISGPRRPSRRPRLPLPAESSNRFNDTTLETEDIAPVAIPSVERSMGRAPVKDQPRESNGHKDVQPVVPPREGRSKDRAPVKHQQAESSGHNDMPKYQKLNNIGQGFPTMGFGFPFQFKHLLPLTMEMRMDRLSEAHRLRKSNRHEDLPPVKGRSMNRLPAEDQPEELNGHQAVRATRF